MSFMHDLYITEIANAKDVCEHPLDVEGKNDVSGFDEYKQLTLLSIFREIPELVLLDRDDKYSYEFYETYHKYFELLYPSEIGDECYAAKFPDDFVMELAVADQQAYSEMASKWLTLEPSFKEFKWNRSDVMALLKQVGEICRKANAERKQVLFRFGL
jgi:hypothetical protein